MSDTPAAPTTPRTKDDWTPTERLFAVLMAVSNDSPIYESYVELCDIAQDALADARAAARKEAQTMADDLQAAWEQLCDAHDRKDDEELSRAIGRLGIGARNARAALDSLSTDTREEPSDE
jgi:hypothetical protein